MNLKCDRSETKYHPSLYCLGVVQYFSQNVKPNKILINICSQLYDNFIDDFFKKNDTNDIIPVEDIKSITDFYLIPSHYTYIFEMQMNCVLLMYCSRFSGHGSFGSMPTDIIRTIAWLLFCK